MARVRTALSLLALPLAAAVSLAGCAGQDSSTAQLTTPPSAQPAETDAPDEMPVSIEAIAAIEHAFAVTYSTDFEYCFEEQMEDSQESLKKAEFSIEADIGTDGRISDTRLVHAHAPGASEALHDEFHGPSGLAERFHGCVEAKLESWELSHPPEAPYTHTVGLSLGQAW